MPSVIELIETNIKRPLLEADQLLIANWRYHLSYYENFLTKYLVLVPEKEGLDLLKSLFNGAADPRTSQAVKKYLASYFSEIIESRPETWLRNSIQTTLLKDFAQSNSSQVRLVFVFFLETLVPRISSTLLKQTYLEAYFNLAKDSVTSIVLAYLSLMPEVRLRLHDQKTIDELTQTLQALALKFKDRREIMTHIEEVKAQLNDAAFYEKITAFHQ